LVGRFTASVLILAVSTASGCSIEQPVSGPVTLTGEWKTVTPPEPLRVGHKHQQKFCLTVGLMRDVEFERGVALDDGTSQRHEIEGEAVDSEGTRYPLQLGEAGGDHVCLYRAGESIPSPNFPADRAIATLRLRSEPPLQVAGIRWHSYDQH